MKGNAEIIAKVSKREKLTEIEEEYVEETMKQTEKKGLFSRSYHWFKSHFTSSNGGVTRQASKSGFLLEVSSPLDEPGTPP